MKALYSELFKGAVSLFLLLILSINNESLFPRELSYVSELLVNRFVNSQVHISTKKIISLEDATSAVAQRKPKKKSRLAGIRTLTSAVPVQGCKPLSELANWEQAVISYIPTLGFSYLPVTAPHPPLHLPHLNFKNVNDTTSKVTQKNEIVISNIYRI